MSYGYLKGTNPHRWTGGGGSSGSFFPGVDGATEIWNFNHTSGNLTGSILGDTYALTGTGGSYNQAGPSGTDLRTYSHENELWVDTSINSSLIPGTSSFTVVYVASNDTDYDHTIFDLDSDAGTTNGVLISQIGTSLFMVARDALQVSQTEWTEAAGASALRDGSYHHVRIIADRSTTKFEVELDGVSQTTSKTSGVDLSAIATINPTGGMGICGQESNGARRFNNSHKIAYIAYAKNVTYNTSLLP
jgi:hypothetical protein